jgi:hypothetical protein
MVLGLLTAGMVAGAAAAAVFLVAGGSIGLALGIFSLVGVAAILAAAFLGFRLSERRESAAPASGETVDPSD